MSTPKIQAISFDVGGTLISPQPSVGDIYASVTERQTPYKLDPQELNRRFLEAWRERDHFEHSRECWADLVDEIFDGLLDTPPSKSFFPYLYGEFAKSSSWKIHDDVLPTLDELASSGIPLAIVSNWDERLRPLLVSLGLSGYFETILISSEVYFSKPSNVIFDHLIRNLGLPAASILHVGDSVSEDVIGARGAGLQTALIDRAGPNSPGRIASLSELTALLEASS